MPTQVDVFALQIPQAAAHSWGWFLVLGVGLVVLGALAIARAVRATVVSMYFFGWLFLIAAVLQAIHVILVGRWSGLFLHLLGVILFAVIGVLLLRHPLAGAEVLTLLMAVYFLVLGVFHIVGTWMVHFPGWPWPMLDGVITLVLGILILAQWPASGLWVIGLFIGIDLLVRGLAWILFALDLRAL